MPFRLLSDDEVRKAAYEVLSTGDWWTIRDIVVKLFPSAIDFSYQFISEYNDEGYDVKARIRSVTGILNGNRVVFMGNDGDLTDDGLIAVKLTSEWKDYAELCERRGYGGPDEEDFISDYIYNLELDNLPSLPEGDDGEVIKASVQHGPLRTFKQLYIAVSE